MNVTFWQVELGVNINLSKVSIFSYILVHFLKFYFWQDFSYARAWIIEIFEIFTLKKKYKMKKKKIKLNIN